MMLLVSYDIANVLANTEYGNNSVEIDTGSRL